jgi:hypothetical protein
MANREQHQGRSRLEEEDILVLSRAVEESRSHGTRSRRRPISPLTVGNVGLGRVPRFAGLQLSRLCHSDALVASYRNLKKGFVVICRPPASWFDGGFSKQGHEVLDITSCI